MTFSAFNALEAVGRAIHEIKSEDRLTWADIGAVFGVSDDQAAKYAEGTAAMNVVTYARAKREWNGRFTRYLDQLCENSRPGITNDFTTLSAILEAAAVLSHALEDGEVSQREVRDHRKELESARDAIDAQLRKLRPAA